MDPTRRAIMTLFNSSAAPSTVAFDDEVAVERRRAGRVRLSLDVSYSTRRNRDRAATTFDISHTGTRLVAEDRLEIGERLVLHIDKLGLFRGEVTRTLPNGFAVLFSDLPVSRRT